MAFTLLLGGLVWWFGHWGLFVPLHPVSPYAAGGALPPLSLCIPVTFKLPVALCGHVPGSLNPLVPGTCHLSPGPGTWAAGSWVPDP